MPQPLPGKEQTLFRSVVKYYEGKQYKKGAPYHTSVSWHD